MLGYFAVVAVATGTLLVWAAGQPHATATASENESGGSSVTATLAQGSPRPLSSRRGRWRSSAPSLRTRLQRCRPATRLARGAGQGPRNRMGRTTRRLWQPLDDTAWTVLDGQIDSVLKALRASTPDPRLRRRLSPHLLRSSEPTGDRSRPSRVSQFPALNADAADSTTPVMRHI